MDEKRVTVKIECKRKTFYLAFLKHWRSRLNDAKDLNMSRSCYMAMEGLKKYPLQVKGVHALKQIKGFGDVMACRCDAAWDIICSNRQCELTMDDVKQLNAADFDNMIYETRDAKARNAETRKENAAKRKQKITTITDLDDEFLDKDDQPRTKVIRLERQNSEPTIKPRADVPLSRWNSELLKSKPDSDFPPVSRPPASHNEFAEFSDDEIQIIQPSSSKATCSCSPFKAPSIARFNSASSSCNSGDTDVCGSAVSLTKLQPSATIQSTSYSSQVSIDGEIRFGTCEPFQQPEVILILDHREHQGKKKAGKAIMDALDKLGMRYELRILSVGDYLWVARKIDGSEIVLDQVIERKTWADLHSSITKHRYEDQKQRLRDVPCRDKVYLIEGPKMQHHGSNAERSEMALKQAVVTTMLRDGFRIQMTDNAKKTALYLQIVTKRFMEKVHNEKMSGIVFDDLQIIGKKNTAQTVKELWIRQLTVVPGMSVTRAGLLAERFPTMVSLLKFYNSHTGDRSMLIFNIIPAITKPASAHLANFFC